MSDDIVEAFLFSAEQRARRDAGGTFDPKELAQFIRETVKEAGLGDDGYVAYGYNVELKRRKLLGDDYTRPTREDYAGMTEDEYERFFAAIDKMMA